MSTISLQGLGLVRTCNRRYQQISLQEGCKNCSNTFCLRSDSLAAGRAARTALERAITYVTIGKRPPTLVAWSFNFHLSLVRPCLG